MSQASSEDYSQAAGEPEAATPGRGGEAEPEPELEAKPWWQEVCESIAAGEQVDAVRAGLVVQQQAQAYATKEWLAAEEAAQRLAAERGVAEGQLLQALGKRSFLRKSK